MNTRIINFIGAPGVGKSTAAVGLFYHMKREQFSVEYTGEFAKDVTYDGHNALLEDQWYMFSQQLRRQYRLLGKIKYVITDSPLILSAAYLDWHASQGKELHFDKDFINESIEHFINCFNQFDNINFYMPRTIPYKKEGRMDFELAKSLDEIIQKFVPTVYNEITPETPINQLIRMVRLN